jgi:hypothetical protein
MFAPRQNESGFMFAVRWTARLLSAISIGALLLIMFSGGTSLSPATWKEVGLLLLFPLGLLIGLVLGWQEERKGGALALLSVASFYLAYGLLLQRPFTEVSWVLLFLAPGLTQLFYGVLRTFPHSNVAAGQE